MNWEYRVVRFYMSGVRSGTELDMCNELNQFGNDGWDLVTTEMKEPIRPAGVGDMIFYFFMKRPKGD